MEGAGWEQGWSRLGARQEPRRSSTRVEQGGRRSRARAWQEQGFSERVGQEQGRNRRKGRTGAAVKEGRSFVFMPISAPYI